MKRHTATALLLLALGAPSAAQAATLRPVDQDGLNVRSGPSTSHQILGTLASSQSAPVLGREGEWFRVRTPAGIEGWVAGQFSRINYEDEQLQAVVKTDILNLRSEPTTASAIRAQLLEGQQVRLLEVVGEWWRVQLPSGVEGWVAATYMEQVTVQPAQPPVSDPAPPPAEPAPAEPEPVPAQPTRPAAPPPAPPGTVPQLPPQQIKTPATGAPKYASTPRATGVFAGRSTTLFERVDTVEAGETLTFINSADGWLHVETPRGRRGWIPGAGATIWEEKAVYSVTGNQWSLGFWAPAQAPVPTPPAATAPTTIWRAVRDNDGLRLRQSPSTEAAILTVLPQGAEMEVLESQEPWLRVRTATGQTGWVHGEFTVLLAPPASQPPAVPGGHGPTFADGFRATLTAPEPGVLRLTVESEAHPLGLPRQEASSLLIPVATGLSTSAVLPVGTNGVEVLALGQSGVGLSFANTPIWEVISASPAQVVVELRPELKALTVRAETDRQVYALELMGFLAPSIKAEGDRVILELPGVARLPEELPEGVQAEVGPKGLTLIIDSRQAYTLKRTATGFELHLFTPGLAGKVILLDPGHGGMDAGAWNSYLGIREKELNLAVSLRLRQELEARGATVLMTRATDVQVAPAELLASVPSSERHQTELGYRTRMANELGVDLFLSVHHNAGTGSGTETYYTGGTLNGANSGGLARLIQEELLAALGTVNRGVKDNLFFVTRNTEVPAALLEIGFVSHNAEAQRLATPEFQWQAVDAIIRALERFYAERP